MQKVTSLIVTSHNKFNIGTNADCRYIRRQIVIKGFTLFTRNWGVFSVTILIREGSYETFKKHKLYI